jgi:hypothetical protein
MIITAAITAAVAFVARLFGIKLSTSALIAVAVVVKILLVVLGMLLSARVLRWRESLKRAEAEANPIAKPGPGEAPPG